MGGALSKNARPAAALAVGVAVALVGGIAYRKAAAADKERKKTPEGCAAVEQEQKRKRAVQEAEDRKKKAAAAQQVDEDRKKRAAAAQEAEERKKKAAAAEAEQRKLALDGKKAAENNQIRMRQPRLPMPADLGLRARRENSRTSALAEGSAEARGFGAR